MTILIKNGLIHDGLGNAPVKSDIFIQNKRIVRLGTFPKKFADETIDASGMIVTPGLIDFNFDAEGPNGIVADPGQKGSVRRGVTTILGGGSGVSLAPILAGSIEFMREWGITSRFNSHWHSLGSFLKTIEERKIGVNFGTLVGYSTVRRFFTNGSERDLTIRETESAKKIVNESFHEGALGFSIDLASAHASRIPVREMSEMARETAKARRIYVTSLRRLDDVSEALGEVLEIGRAAGVNLEINGLRPLRGMGEAFPKILEMIERESAKSRINFEIFPYPLAVLPIRSFLPNWLSMEGISETLRMLEGKNVKDRILKHFEKIKLEELKIAEVPPHLKLLEGKAFEDFAKNRGLTKARALLKLMTLTGLKGSVVSRRVDKKIFEEFLKDQRSLISLAFPNVAGESAGAGSFLASVEKDKKLPVEKAIAKMTGLAAAKYGLEKRGLVREGHWADLALWENWNPKTVVVNGSIAMRDGAIIGGSTGMILKP